MEKTGWIGPAVSAGIGLYNSYTGTRTNISRVRRMSVEDNVGGLTYTKRRLRHGRYRRRNARRVFQELASFIGGKYIWRWQNMSNSLIGAGQMPIGWATLNAQGSEWMPIHFMSLTQCPFGDGNNTFGTFTTGMKMLYYSTVTGDWNMSNANSQSFTGDIGPDGFWRADTNMGSQVQPNCSKIFHKWTDLRFNFYGCRAVPITYNIYLIRFPQAYDLQSATTHAGTSEVANMLKDIARPLCGNPIAQNGRVEWYKDVQIVRRTSMTIQPLNYSDQIGANSTKTAHVRQLKWFIRHDTLRDYKWYETRSIQQSDMDFLKPGWDVTVQPTMTSDVEWGKKLYLVITATSPQKMSTQPAIGADMTTWGELQGTYDICVRNCFGSHSN